MMLRSAALILSSLPRSLTCAAIISLHRRIHAERPSTPGRRRERCRLFDRSAAWLAKFRVMINFGLASREALHWALRRTFLFAILRETFSPASIWPPLSSCSIEDLNFGVK